MRRRPERGGGDSRLPVSCGCAELPVSARRSCAGGLSAGINYPSDVSVGLELGRAVGPKVVAMAQNDGSQAVWTGFVPAELRFLGWDNTARAARRKVEDLGTLSRDQLRPGPPPPYNSPEKRAELDEIKNYPAHVCKQCERILLPVARRCVSCFLRRAFEAHPRRASWMRTRRRRRARMRWPGSLTTTAR